MEYLELLDENKNLTGKIIERGTMFEESYYVNIVIVFIENSKGEFLIQKTSKEKGNVWATTGGHVKAGSAPLVAITEEIKEELGIDVKANEISHIMIDKRTHTFQDVYYLKKDIDINDLILQKEEVEFVKWLSIDEINKLIENNEFREGNIKPFKYLINEYRGVL